MVTKKETYLYGQLFALAKEQLAALDKRIEGRLGIWGKNRLNARTRRLSKVLQEIFILKIKSDVNDPDLVLSEINKDLVSLRRAWDDVSQGELDYLKSMTDFARDS